MTTNKPDFKRYNITIDKYDHPVPYETEHGQWVKYSSYKALQAECEKLRKAAETSAADANAAERECSKALRALEGLERVAKVVSDNSDAVCGENNQLRVECEKLRKDAERYQWLKHHAIKGSYDRDWEFPLVDAWEYRPGSEANVEHESLDAAIDAATHAGTPC